MSRARGRASGIADRVRAWTTRRVSANMVTPFEAGRVLEMKRFGHPVNLLLTVPQGARLA
jgi:hypothetical protein